jgi:hypothetical protein
MRRHAAGASAASTESPDRRGADVKRTWRTLAWRTLALAGGFTLTALTGSAAIAEEPVEAERPAEESLDVKAYGFPYASPVAPAAVATVPPPPVAVTTMPAWVGVYRVGKIHRPWFAHIFWYSAYNPYLDELHDPFQRTIYDGAHARYYAGYREIHTPNWSQWYLPQAQCYSPGAYGYQPHGAAPSAADAPPSTAAPYGAYYGPGYYGPNFPGGAYPLPERGGVNTTGFRYTGERSVFSPYGVGSASYFGAYGGAGQ